MLAYAKYIQLDYDCECLDTVKTPWVYDGGYDGETETFTFSGMSFDLPVKYSFVEDDIATDEGYGGFAVMMSDVADMVMVSTPDSSLYQVQRDMEAIKGEVFEVTPQDVHLLTTNPAAEYEDVRLLILKPLTKFSEAYTYEHDDALVTIYINETAGNGEISIDTGSELYQMTIFTFDEMAIKDYAALILATMEIE